MKVQADGRLRAGSRPGSMRSSAPTRGRAETIRVDGTGEVVHDFPSRGAQPPVDPSRVVLDPAGKAGSRGRPSSSPPARQPRQSHPDDLRRGRSIRGDALVAPLGPLRPVGRRRARRPRPDSGRHEGGPRRPGPVGDGHGADRRRRGTAGRGRGVEPVHGPPPRRCPGAGLDGLRDFPRRPTAATGIRRSSPAPTATRPGSSSTPQPACRRVVPDQDCSASTALVRSTWATSPSPRRSSRRRRPGRSHAAASGHRQEGPGLGVVGAEAEDRLELDGRLVGPAGPPGSCPGEDSRRARHPGRRGGSPRAARPSRRRGAPGGPGSARGRSGTRSGRGRAGGPRGTGRPIHPAAPGARTPRRAGRGPRCAGAVMRRPGSARRSPRRSSAAGAGRRPG